MQNSLGIGLFYYLISLMTIQEVLFIILLFDPISLTLEEPLDLSIYTYLDMGFSDWGWRPRNRHPQHLKLGVAVSHLGWLLKSSGKLH